MNDGYAHDQHARTHMDKTHHTRERRATASARKDDRYDGMRQRAGTCEGAQRAHHDNLARDNGEASRERVVFDAHGRLRAWQHMGASVMTEGVVVGSGSAFGRLPGARDDAMVGCTKAKQ
jgi:hypothetical protein